MTENKADKTARFETLSETYGGNLNRWPAETRDWAAAALRADPALQKMLDEAGALDLLLDDAPAAPRLGAETIGAILAQAPRQKRAFVFWPFGSIWRPAAGLLAAMVLGISVGAVYPSAASLPVGLTSASNGEFSVPAELTDADGAVPLGDLD